MKMMSRVTCHLWSVDIGSGNGWMPSGNKPLHKLMADPNVTLHWRHNDHGSVSNHQPHGCLLNRLLRRRSKKTSKLRVTGHCAGNSPGPVNSPHKGPVTRKMVPFNDVIMNPYLSSYSIIRWQWVESGAGVSTISRIYHDFTEWITTKLIAQPEW